MKAGHAGSAANLLVRGSNSAAEAEVRKEYLRAALAVTRSARVIRRPATLAELAATGFAAGNGTNLDGRYVDANARAQEPFALAMSDIAQADYILHRLPKLALAVRLLEPRDGDRAALIALVRGQVMEIVDHWRPLQRPGWTCLNEPCRSPGGIADGVWLATGRSLIALQLTLDFLPKDVFSPAELEKVEALLFEEASRVRSDFERGVPWYVRAKAFTSNQWIVPASGLLVVAGARRDRPGWALLHAAGRSYVERTLAALGSGGDMPEGWSYAYVSAFPLYLAAAYAGDDAGDLLAHPFFRAFPDWLASRMQPGWFTINAGDCNACGGIVEGARRFKRLFALAELLTGSGQARWANDRLTTGAAGQLDFMIYLALASRERPAPKEPSRQGWHAKSAIYHWRSSSAVDADGFWIRGRSLADTHAHEDAGHITLYASGMPVLIEAGMPASYADPDVRLYQSAWSHNSLSVIRNGSPAHMARTDTPLEQAADPASPPKISLDLGGIYPETIASYRRSYALEAVSHGQPIILRVSDRLRLHTLKQELRFRWHTGSDRALEITHLNGTTSRVSFSVGDLDLLAEIVAPTFCRVAELARPAAHGPAFLSLHDGTLPSRAHRAFEVGCVPTDLDVDVVMTLTGEPASEPSTSGGGHVVR